MTISFGPYHHGKPEHQAAENLKNCGMRTYISEAGKSIEDFSVRYLKRMPTLEAVIRYRPTLLEFRYRPKRPSQAEIQKKKKTKSAKRTI